MRADGWPRASPSTGASFAILSNHIRQLVVQIGRVFAFAARLG
jgi:hypothetical protein